MENAFIKVIAATDADKKIRQALKKGILENKLDYTELVSDAVEKDVVTLEEAKLLQEATDARWDAIQVDAYPPSWFSGIVESENDKLNAA